MELIGAETLASELLRAGLSVRFVARGQSMRPLIRDGAVLRIKPLDGPTRFRKGDILFCALSTQAGEVALVHRLLRRLPDGCLLTRGDHQPHPDRPIQPYQVLGRVYQIEQANHVINLELPLWRLIGWFIATASNWQLFLRKVWATLKG